MKFALVGCGLIGKKRIESLIELNEEIAGIYDSDKERLNKVSKDYDLKKYKSLDDLFQDSPNCVIVATVHSELYGICKKVITSGIHLFVEKPGVTNVNQANDLHQLASQHKVDVGIGFNHRFHPAILRAKEIIDQKTLGKILYLRASYGHGGRSGMESEWRCNREISGGGELIDQGSHLIDLSRFFLGEVTYKYSHIDTYFWDTDVEDNVFFALSNDSGAFAWLHASWTEWKNKFSFEIFCERGKLHITGLGRSYGEEKLILYKMKPELGPPDVEEFSFSKEDNSWKDEISAFIDAINGTRNDFSSSGDLIKLHQIVESIYRKKK